MDADRHITEAVAIRMASYVDYPSGTTAGRIAYISCRPTLPNDKLCRLSGTAAPDEQLLCITDVSGVGKYVKDKMRPVMVKLNYHEGKTEILQEAKILKDIQSFKRIFIAPDMTSQQQAVDKELRLKLKEFREANESDAKIKSGKIIKNVDGGKGVMILYRPPK